MSEFKEGDRVRLVGLHPEDSRYIDRVEYEGYIYIYEPGLSTVNLRLIPKEKYGFSEIRRRAIFAIGNILTCYQPIIEKV